MWRPYAYGPQSGRGPADRLDLLISWPAGVEITLDVRHAGSAGCPLRQAGSRPWRQDRLGDVGIASSGIDRDQSALKMRRSTRAEWR